MKKITLFIVAYFFLSIVVFQVQAQAPTSSIPCTADQAGEATLGVARMIETNEKNVVDGTLLSAGTNKGAIRTNFPYDSKFWVLYQRMRQLS